MNAINVILVLKIYIFIVKYAINVKSLTKALLFIVKSVDNVELEKRRLYSTVMFAINAE